jgi:MarR family transcriptional regulator for hemolysin
MATRKATQNSSKARSKNPARKETMHRAIAALQRLSDLFSERRDQLAREAGLSVPQWRLLEEIATEHFMPSLFATRRSVTPAAISKLVRGLLDANLIEAGIGASDRRKRTYHLTAAGRRTMERVRASRQQAIDEVWSDISTAELERFAGFGDRLSERLERYLDE